MADSPILEDKPGVAPKRSKRIPPLQNGDRLTREEFHRRYEAMPHVKKAELIEGVVYMSSPVNHEYHGGPHFDLIAWLVFYRLGTPGLNGGDNSSLLLDVDNEPQPDAFLMILPEFGGQVRFENGYVTRAPELACEVSASSASYDLHGKLNAYRRNGVREYLVWRVYDDAIDWFVLEQGRYVPLTADAAGIIRSKVFPGLWLDPSMLIAQNMQGLFQLIQQGLASPEHAAFVAELQSRRGSPPAP